MLSVVLAIYNEEQNLARCLDSVKLIADEIVVVDGSSTDNSVEIAKKYTKKIIETTNKSNFHINKQMAMDAATGDIVLQLDADEVVDDDLANYIKQLKNDIKEGTTPTDSAWWIPRKNLFLGSYLTKGGQYPDSVIRLYLKGKARLPQKDVHEQMEVEGSIGTANGHLIHYSNPTFADYLRKFNTYTSFTAEKLHKKHTTISFTTSLDYLVKKPLVTFFSIYARHRGYVDGIPGFMFALMSSLHFPIAYIKLWELSEK
ncbi:MAG: glycosyltransferase family 2 protein [Candidatus Pacebacteria bacterium]|nr:glycosyltransferase family 2 protein [Candidatus Paceibacterota bacterium]PIR63863.1 MAG: hypothetical protein COU64_02735 [Candidatus Pacebacteria bacterium CG10_big_fil_rev_8_21_14_0_10_40_26]PIZ78361.1 MAG: hypothetical protein COY01_06295 [Candidatus Pacebacteria bacterium CG_4_10_14_0_2_um_filter_40_20]PJA68595.1 MAG: hypothetical protein CO156_03750 [Candidatus Pacebacteria bacterium CG_4_9_14_3_um_filter_40_12]PJC41535.1 MAG: hypothetical protein CO041_02340 [Candidatus Pacebacteria b